MRLEPGQTAIEFSVEDINGRAIKLSEFKGEKLLLSFFRYAS